MGVVTQTEDLPPAMIPLLATEIGAPVTGFLFASDRPDTSFRIEAYTRDGAAAGHSIEATLGTFHALAESGLFPDQDTVGLSEEAPDGSRHPVEIRFAGGNVESVHVTPDASPTADPTEIAAIARVLDMSASDVQDVIPLLVDDRLVIHFPKRDGFDRFRPASGARGHARDFDGITAVTFDTDERGTDALVRDFSWDRGPVVENPFRARAHFAAANHAFGTGLARGIRRFGHGGSGLRGGVAIVQPAPGGRITIGGEATTTIHGRMSLPSARGAVRVNVHSR